MLYFFIVLDVIYFLGVYVIGGLWMNIFGDLRVFLFFFELLMGFLNNFLKEILFEIWVFWFLFDFVLVGVMIIGRVRRVFFRGLIFVDGVGWGLFLEGGLLKFWVF